MVVRCGRGIGARGFTLIELLVVVALTVLLIGILVPSLSAARRAALVARDVANLHNFEQAHQVYVLENNGRFVDVGLAHGGVDGDEGVAWINTLRRYYGGGLLVRSPLDRSPHWPGGVPVPGSGGLQYRRTSYGVNNFTTNVSDNGLNPYGVPPVGVSVGDWPGGDGRGYARMDRVERPAATVHFLHMSWEGEFAGADHPHVEDWYGPPSPAVRAARQVETSAAGGEVGSDEAVSVYGFLDGHVETRAFGDIYVDIDRNSFNPKYAH